MSVFSVSLYCIIVAYSKEVVGFNTRTEPAVHTRATAYDPRVIDKTCALKPDRGPCRGGIKMYYFSVDNMACSTFEWGGCQGNGNRFDTEAQCMRACTSQPNPPKQRPKWCSLSFDYGFCFGAIERWYYDPLWSVCKKTLYSGCGGNKNNFYNAEQCESVCRFGNGWISSITKHTNAIEMVLVVNPNQTTMKG